ncbi:unnamed protein product [Discula destructiva]
MRYSIAIASLGAALTQAHYTLPSINNGAQWENVRKTANHYSNGPVTDVSSPEMTCYQLSSGYGDTTTADVQAGTSVTYNVSPDLFHPGSFSAWLAKAPPGETAATYDGSGENWFKIYQDAPTVSSSGLSWASQNKPSIDIPIPSCVEDGEYLLRAEQIALHTAGTVGGAQFYLSCAQISISGGTGTAKPTMFSFPGAYSAEDPGILINLYWPIPTNYTAPGGPALKC